MGTIKIKNGVVELKLTSPRSKIRICDDHGNHVAKPSLENVTFETNYVEWMITNDELMQLISQKFSKQDIARLIEGIKEVKISLRDSDYYSRAAQKQNINQSIEGFSVYKYKEVFYSFEKSIDENLKVKITFKMGDFTLAAHMFVLIRLSCPDIKLTNRENNIGNNKPLGSGASCSWSPSKETIVETARALAHSSKNHKKDIINLLENLIKQRP